MAHHSLLEADNRRAAQAAGLRLTVHGPFLDLYPGSPDEALRRAAVETHRRHIEAAADIGATVYVAHPDFAWEPFARDPAVVAALTRSIAELGEAQRETGVRVVMENMPGMGRSHYVSPGDLDLGELGLLLDTGHAAISGTLEAFLTDPQATLAHVHLHDNRGPSDADDPHRPLGEGIVDAASVLAAAREAQALVILELTSEADVVASMRYLRARGLIPA